MAVTRSMLGKQSTSSALVANTKSNLRSKNEPVHLQGTTRNRSKALTASTLPAITKGHRISKIRPKPTIYSKLQKLKGPRPPCTPSPRRLPTPPEVPNITGYSSTTPSTPRKRKVSEDPLETNPITASELEPPQPKRLKLNLPKSRVKLLPPKIADARSQFIIPPSEGDKKYSSKPTSQSEFKSRLHKTLGPLGMKESNKNGQFEHPKSSTINLTDKSEAWRRWLGLKKAETPPALGERDYSSNDSCSENTWSATKLRDYSPSTSMIKVHRKKRIAESEQIREMLNKEGFPSAHVIERIKERKEWEEVFDLNRRRHPHAYLYNEDTGPRIYAWLDQAIDYEGVDADVVAAREGMTDQEKVEWGFGSIGSRIKSRRRNRMQR